MHRDPDTVCMDGAKLSGGLSGQNRKDASSNPAENSAHENGHSPIESNAAGDKGTHPHKDCHDHPHAKAAGAKGAAGHARRFSKNISRIAARAAAVLVAAVMTISLGGFAGDVMASANTTPYTSIDVPLTSDDGSGHSDASIDDINNSDNADPDRVEADNGITGGISQGAGTLGPMLPPASGRDADLGEVPQGASGPDEQSNTQVDSKDNDKGSILVKGHITYIENKDEFGEFDGTYTLKYADPEVGKVVTIPTSVTAIEAGAFTDCPDIQTIVVMGQVKSIAEPERDLFGNVTKQGAFTDEQLERVHVVFAVNTVYTDGADGHTHDHDGDAADGNEANDTANDAEGNAPSEAADSTPVDEGIKRLSKDVILSTPTSKSSKQNIWGQLGFRNMTDDVEIGATSTEAIWAAGFGESDTQNSANQGNATNASQANIPEDAFTLTMAKDYTLEAAWNGAAETPSDLTVPAYGVVGGITYKVTRIAEGAFKDNKDIQSLTIEDGITHIDASAFEGCENLKEVDLPSTLQVIGDRAFMATGIEDAQIPKDTEQIGEYAFANCPNLKQVGAAPSDNGTEGTGSDGSDNGTGIDSSTEAGTGEDGVKGDAATADEDNAVAADGGSDTTDGPSAAELAADFMEEEAAEDELVEAALTNEKLEQLKGTDATGIATTAFTDTAAQVDDKVYRQTYLASGKTDSFRINPKGGTWKGFYFASAADVLSGKQSGISGYTSTMRFYWGDSGKAHLCVRPKDRTKHYWDNNWTSASGGARPQITGSIQYNTPYSLPITFFTATRPGYTFLYCNNTVGAAYTVCSDCAYDVFEESDLIATEYYEIEWQANKYTITLNANGGSHTKSSVQATYDSNYPDMGTPTRSGYTFLGWYTASSGGSKKTTSDKYTTAGNQTLYAQWSKNSVPTYTVTLNGMGGSISPTYVTVSQNGTYPSLPTPTKSGYSFQGWYTASSGGTYKTAGSSLASNSNHTLYAHWAKDVDPVTSRYTVTLNRNGGSSQTVSSVTVNKDGTYPYLGSAARSGYTFDGWYTAASGGTYKTQGSSIASNSNHTLYAHWTYIPVEVKPKYHVYITHRDNCGYYRTTAWGNGDYNAGDTVTVYLTGDTYGFSRWGGYINSTTVTSSFTMPSKDVYLDVYYKAKEHYDITWNVTAYGGYWYYYNYGDTVYSDNASKGTTILPGETPSQSQTPVKPGYTFAGWKTHDSSGNLTQGITAVTKNTTYYATFKADTYSITFKTNDGSQTISTLTYQPATADALLANPGRNKVGYHSVGWATSANQKEAAYTFGQSYTQSNSTDLTLYLADAPNTDTTYYVEHYLQNPGATGTVTDSNSYLWLTQTKTGTTDTQTNAEALTREGFTVQAGWTQQTINGNGNTVVKIYYKINSFTITLIAANGTLNAATGWTISGTRATKTYQFGEELGVTPTANRAGYRLGGWSTADMTTGATAPTNFINPMTVLTGAKTYYAYWSFAVTYDGNGSDGGTVPQKTTYYTGSAGKATHTISSTAPTRTDYDFKGWWTDPSAGTQYTMGSNYEFAGDVTIYAHWELTLRTITMSAQSASGTDGATISALDGWELSADRKTITKRIKINSDLGTLPTATRGSKYTFVGWRAGDLTAGTSTAPGDLISSTTKVTQNITYHAVWSFSVSYSGNGNTGGTVPGATTYYTGSSGTASHTVSTAALTRTNYNWYGWLDTDITGTSTAPTKQTGAKTIAGNKTYYGSWSFSVRYSANNKTTGTIPNAATYYTGSSGSATHAVTTNAFTRTHYDWHGWAYTDITGSATAPTTYTGNITVTPNDDANKCRWLYASWKFYVGYSGNNDAVSGTVPANVTLYAGSAGSAAYTTQNPSLTQRGYRFGRNSGHAQEDSYTNTLNANLYPNKWNTRADSSGTYYTGLQAVTLTPTTANTDSTGKKIVLYGQWTLIRYNITYNLNGGRAENNKDTYTVRDASFTLNKPTRPGYDFSPGTDANGPFAISTCGWTGNYNTSAKEGQSGYSMPRTDNLTIHQGSIGQITLTANWHLHEYQISYSLNGGALPSMRTNPSTYNTETATFTLVNPEKYPFTFNGWSVTGADAEGAAIDTQGVQTRILKGTIGTLVCTAGWESFKYNIAYDGNGETGGWTESTAAEYGKQWTAPSNGFTKEGFNFDSWNTQANGRGQKYEAGKAYTDNLVSERGQNAVLYAIWKANPYTIRFNPNYTGATASTYTQDVNCGEERELAANRFTRTGYVFAGWSEIAGEQAVKFTDMQKIKDLETVSGRTHELYAQWTPITYMVNFLANNTAAEGATNPQTLTYDRPEALHGCGYIVEGLKFDGWNTSSDGEGTKYKDYEMVKNLSTRAGTVINLYAQWAPIEYKITYVINEANVDGIDMQQSSHTWGEWKALTSVKELGWTWTGHHFDGWYTEANHSGTSYSDMQSVRNLTTHDNDNVMLYAKWAPDVHRVTLDARGGTYVQSAYHDNRWMPISGGVSAYRDIEYGDIYASDLGLPTFSKPGYDFAGWWTVAEPTEDNPGTEIAAGDQHVFLELADQTLYARWTPIKYKYQLAIETADGGTRYLSDAAEVDFEQEVYMPDRNDQVGIGETQELKKYAKSGYLIVGWSLNRASETAEYALGSMQSGLTTDSDPNKVVVVWAIQKLGDYYVTYYKDEAQTERHLTETIRKDQSYYITTATVDRPGYVQTHWEIPSAGHIRYTPGSYVQSNNLITGQFELGDEIAVIPVWQKVQITVQFSDAIGTKVPANFQIGFEDRVTRLNRNSFSTAEGDFTFEGYWTEPSGNGVMLYDATGKPAGPNANEDGLWRYPPDEGTTLVTLYAKWTCPVTFEFPYGGGVAQTYNFIAYTGYSDIANAKNLDHLKEGDDGNLEDANYVDTSWYADWVKGLFNPVHTIDPAHEWAGWYTKPELGRAVSASREVEEPVTLYGCWKVYANFNYWNDPLYSSGWTLRGNNVEQVEDEYGNAIPDAYRQQVVQGQTYKTNGLLPSATRAGYITEADCWNDDPEGNILLRVPGQVPVYNPNNHLAQDTVVKHEDDYEVYLEYSFGRANVRIERWLQDIGGMDYTHVEDDDSTDTLTTESLIDDALYTDDGPSTDYHGFTYDHFDTGSTKPGVTNRELRVAGDGTTVVRLYYARHTFALTLGDFWVTDAGGTDNVRGAAASRGTYPTPDANVERAESEGFGTLSGITTSTGTKMTVWYGQTIEIDAVADTGYEFDRWLVTDGDGAGYVKLSEDGRSTLTGDAVETKVKDATAASPDEDDAEGDGGEDSVENAGTDADGADNGGDSAATDGDGAAAGEAGDTEADVATGVDAGASAQSDIPTYTFMVRDSAPYALATFKPQDVEYEVEAYFEGMGDASASPGTFTRDYANARGADMDGLTAKTDSMTQITTPGSEAAGGEVALREIAGFKVASIEVGSKSTETSNGSIRPDVLLDSTDAKVSVNEDPDTYANAAPWIENQVVKGDGSTVVRVFYKRCAYTMDVTGSKWADATGTAGTAPARLALFDSTKQAYITATGEDVQASPGKNTYAAFYEAEVSVAARAVGHAELTGYTSDRNDIPSGAHGETYGFDSQTLLDHSLLVPADTDGLPKWNDSRYQDSMYGFAAYRMPAADVVVTVEAQPVRASYISRYLFQDADPASETAPAATYTLNRASEMDADESYEDVVTRTSDGSRYLRYWIDGTDAENHALDVTGFEPSSAEDAITALVQLTPQGNEVVDGEAANVTYSKYDRKRHSVTYTYAGGPNEADNQAPDGTPAPATVGSYYGARVRVAPAHAINGWDFSGWMWAQDPDTSRDDFPYVGEGTDSASITVPDADVAITGTWSPISFTLTYDGGSAEATPANPMSPTSDSFGKADISFGDRWQVADTAPTRPGYTFLGWTFADSGWDARLADQPTMTEAQLAAYRQELADTTYFGGVPLLMQPGEMQAPWSFHQETGRTLHAVWMRNTYDLVFDLGDGTWATGTDVPLSKYMTGSRIPIPQPVLKGYGFAGWEVECDGSPVNGDPDAGAYPAITFTDDAHTQAAINEWTYGKLKLTAKYDVIKYNATLNTQGGTFDGGYEGDGAQGITPTYPEGDAPFGTATLSIPYGTEITESTDLPEPTRPGYNFTGWVDASGTPIGYEIEYDESGTPSKTDRPYTFDPDTDTMWVATWKGIAYRLDYRWGDDHPADVAIDGAKFKDSHGYAHDSFASDMTRTLDGKTEPVVAFELPTGTDLTYTNPDGVTYSFEGWYTTPDYAFGTGIRSFDPAAVAAELVHDGKDSYTLYAKWSKGTIAFKERFWLEVLDTEGLGLDREWIADGASGAEPRIVDGRTYIAQKGRAYVCDDTLTLDRAGDWHQGVTAQGTSPAGYVFDDDTDNYRADYPFGAFLNNASGTYTVNGFYNLARTLIKVGTGAEGIDDDMTGATVTSGKTPIWDTDEQGWLNSDGKPWTPGDGDRYVSAPYGTDVTLECTPEPGYGFASWVPTGTAPSDLDVFDNPTGFKAPDYEVSVTPFASLIAYKAYYHDNTGAALSDIAQATYTVKDEFALANAADIKGHTFSGWTAAMADADGHPQDTAEHPVPATVGYDDATGLMWVHAGTTGDLVFTATYDVKEYTVTIEVPDEARRDADGYPAGLERDPRLGWSVDPESGDVSFTYTPETLGATDDPIIIDLSAIDAHPYRIDGWGLTPDAGNDEGDNPPVLDDSAIVISPETTGSANVASDGATPKSFTLIVDPNQGVPEGYEVDMDGFTDDMQGLIDEIAASDSPDKPVITDNGDGTWTVGFTAESEPQVALPEPVLLPEDGTDPDEVPEFLGWADNADGTNPMIGYAVPGSDLSGFEEGVPVRPAPVWVAGGDRDASYVIVHMPDPERAYHTYDEGAGATNEWTFRFAGTPLSETKGAYASDAAFNAKVTPTDGYHLGYHVEWHSYDADAGAPGDKIASLPSNFPATGTVHVCGVWAQDDDIKPVGFNNVSFGTSGPPGFKGKARSAYAADGADVASAAAYAADTTGHADQARSAYAAGADAASNADVAVRLPYANVTYYYKPSIGLVVKDESNDTFVKVDYIDASIMSAVDQYLDAGWLFDGYYLEGDEAKAIIIAPDGKVNQELLQQKTQSEEIDLMFSDSWTRKQLVKIDFVGGTGDASVTDATLYWWPDLDVFISPDDAPDPEADDRKGALSTIETKNTVVELNGQGLTTPAPRINADGTQSEFLGYFGKNHINAWPKDADGNPIAAAKVGALNAIGVSDVHLDTYTSEDGAKIVMPYGYDPEDPYNPKAPGFHEIRWEAKWQGDLDTVYFNATVPMTMSFAIRADGTAVGPDAGAYQIRNYSNVAISVEDMSFEWADDSKLEALFGKGAADVLALSATPTEGQEGYAASKVVLERSEAAPMEGAGLVSRHVFNADKWVIKKSLGVDPDGYDGDVAALPALKLDYGLTTGGIRQLTQDSASQGETYPIGKLRFTLKTVR